MNKHDAMKTILTLADETSKVIKNHLQLEDIKLVTQLGHHVLLMQN